MPKRKSITGIRRKKPRQSLSDTSSAPDNTPKTRRLPTTRILSPTQSLPIEDAVSRTQQRRKIRRPLKTVLKKTQIANTILSNWIILNEDAQAKVRDVLRSVELPVMAQHTSEQKKVEAQGVVGSLTRTLGNRLPKMVFPPKTRAEYFEYEGLEKGNRTLQSRLTSHLKSCAALEMEVEEQRNALEAEQQELEQLNDSA